MPVVQFCNTLTSDQRTSIAKLMIERHRRLDQVQHAGRHVLYVTDNMVRTVIPVTPEDLTEINDETERGKEILTRAIEAILIKMKPITGIIVSQESLDCLSGMRIFGGGDGSPMKKALFRSRVLLAHLGAAHMEEHGLWLPCYLVTRSEPAKTRFIDPEGNIQDSRPDRELTGNSKTSDRLPDLIIPTPSWV